MSQETARLLLPFSALAENRQEPFSEDAEKAVIFCLAEIERRKGGGIVVKQIQEKTRFIARIHYPFWMVPFHESTLIVDALGISSHTFSYPRIQGTEDFIEGIERSSSSRQLYTAFLTSYITHFQPSDKEDKLVIEGLMGDPAFTNDFAIIFSAAKPFDASAYGASVLSKAIDETALSFLGQELETLKSRVAADIEDLGKSMKLVNRTTKNFAGVIRNEIRETRISFEKELKKHSGPAQEKVKELRLKSDEEVMAASKRFGKELLDLQKEKVRQEKTRDSLTNRIARCEAEIKASSESENEVAERKWKEEREKLKKELSTTESEIKGYEREIKNAEDQKTLELLRIKSDYDAKVREASRELLEIESSRDARVQLLKQEMGKMEELTSTIIKQTDSMAKLREASLAALDKLGFQQEHGDQLLALLPFYVVCYESDSARRYMVVPPSNVNNVKLLVKIKGALGRSRIRQIFSSRSEAIASFVRGLPSLMKNDPAFEGEIDDMGTRVNLTKAVSNVRQIQSGLEQLNSEGWFSEKEYNAFSRSLA